MWPSELLETHLFDKMHGHLVIVLAAAALMVLLAQVPTGDADCCQPWHFYRDRNRCADCSTSPGKYQMCSMNGKCNGFGCACSAPCKEPVAGRTCSATCCDKREDRLDDLDRSRREVTSAAISTPTRNVTGHDVIIAADLDRNGHLDGIEIHLYLTKLHGHVDDVHEWRVLDSNSDGRLTALEIDPPQRRHGGVTAV